MVDSVVLTVSVGEIVVAGDELDGGEVASSEVVAITLLDESSSDEFVGASDVVTLRLAEESKEVESSKVENPVDRSLATELTSSSDMLIDKDAVLSLKSETVGLKLDSMLVLGSMTSTVVVCSMSMLLGVDSRDSLNSVSLLVEFCIEIEGVDKS
jgi:hypothetical protein